MKTKLGLVGLTNHKDLITLGDKGVRIFSLVNEFGMAGELRARYPDAFIVGVVSSNLKLEDSSNPEALANAVFDEQRPKIENTPSVSVWSGINEPNVDDLHRMNLLARVEMERMRLMDKIGKKCALGSFSVGNPPLNPGFWEAWFPVLRYAIDNGHVLAAHEYWWPRVMWMTGAWQLNPSATSGFAPDGRLEGWTPLRYRKVMREHLIPAGVGDIKWIMTEIGADPGVSPHPYGGGGFYGNEGFTDALRKWDHTKDVDKNEIYARDILQYVKWIEEDDCVIGGTVFSVGATGDWQDADIGGTPVIGLLGDYLTGKKVFVPYPPKSPSLAGNLFKNPRFDEIPEGAENGFYMWLDPLDSNRPRPEIRPPVGWDFWYMRDTALRLQGQDQQFFPPEVKWFQEADANQRDRWELFQRGLRMVQVFGAGKPVWFKIFQKLKLVAGQRYHLSVRLFPDSVDTYKDGEKVYATDPIASEYRLIVDNDEPEWLDGKTARIGEFTEVAREFVASGLEQEIGWEVRGRWGLKPNGWFFDEARIVPAGAVAEPPPVIIPPVVIPPIPTRFKIGDRVKVTDTLRVREAPSMSAKILGVQQPGARGDILGGPTLVGAINWYRANYDIGMDGWSSEEFMELVTVTPPVDPPDEPPIDPPPVDPPPASNLTLTAAELADLTAMWHTLSDILNRLEP